MSKKAKFRTSKIYIFSFKFLKKNRLEITNYLFFRQTILNPLGINTIHSLSKEVFLYESPRCRESTRSQKVIQLTYLLQCTLYFKLLTKSVVEFG